MDFSSYKDLVLIVFILIIIVINIGLFSSFRKNKSNGTINLLRKSTEVMRDPFKKEKSEMAELSSLVNKLKETNKLDNNNEEKK
jgi:hypothetical protein